MTKQVKDFLQGIDGTQYFEYDDGTTAKVRADDLQSAVSGALIPSYADQAVAASNAPTLTKTGGTSPASSTAYTNNNAAFDHLGPGPWVVMADTAFIRPFAAAGFARTTFGTDASTFFVGLQNINSNAQFFFDENDGLGWRYAGTITTTAAGGRELVQVTFSTQRPRNFRVEGFNYSFGAVWIQNALGATIYRALSTLPLMHVTSDSYGQGTGAGGTALTCIAEFANSQGYQLMMDGVGSSGWLTASPNSPAERVVSQGQNILVNRNSNVEAAVNISRVGYALGYNDSAGSQSAITASINATYAACAKKPSFFIGPWTPLGDTTNLTTTAATIAAAAASLGALFIPAQGIVTAANAVSRTGGDNVHPTQYGHNVIGYELAVRARALGFA